ncbi:hypothetical protein CN645_05800 [Burkholderia sp. IDO3]|nr:hypothetical protein DCN14_01060 [Burkholderia sp. IDO3]PCD62751.1 hypothetical protein CN645_05800 [Burkholderia sp. IDO3]
MLDRDRLAHPEIRSANPEFRIDPVRRCICAREIVAQDTFGSAPAGHAVARVAGVRDAHRPLPQASPFGVSGCVKRGRARRVERGRDRKGRVM